jgi:hypothetical protein
MWSPDFKLTFFQKEILAPELNRQDTAVLVVRLKWFSGFVYPLVFGEIVRKKKKGRV